MKGMADLLTHVCDVYCDWVTFPFGILGQVWYLIVSTHVQCCLSYFTLLIYISFLGIGEWYFKYV